MARFCPLFSSSKGNSWYVGSGSQGVLVDVGVSAKKLDTALKDLQIDVSSIKGIFLTHEHTDHVGGLRVFASRHNIPVFASNGTLEAVDEKGLLNDKFSANVIEKTGVTVGDMFVKPFEISHDCREGFGYVVQTADSQRATVCTDLGVMTDEIINEISGSDLVVMESNHDVRMLENGPYPYTLKRRILSNHGHLSNDSCAEVLKTLIEKGTKLFCLGHLSDENNSRHLAKQTSVSALAQIGAKEDVDYILQVASNVHNGKITIF